MSAGNGPVLAMRGICKRFGATRALDDVSLDLQRHEVHALVGENGAGKSTLIKVMTGIYPPDEGEVLVDGEPVSLRSAADAQRLGIAAIYQEPLIFPDLSVAENIFIGHQDQGRVVHWRQMCADAEAILARLDVHIDPRIPASGLPVATQQAIEMESAINQLESTPVESDTWIERLRDVMALLDDHLRDEENEFFHRAQELLGENTARELEEPFMARQRELLHALE